MTHLHPRLAVGPLADHRAPDDTWSVCCACGSCRDLPQAPHRLYLDIPDPPIPLFTREPFERFLAWAAGEWEMGRSILIHDDAGVSRAPSLALLFLAKVIGVIPDTGYDEAWDAMEML